MGQIKRLGVLALFMTIFPTGCFKTPARHANVLILAVENLSSTDVACATEPRSGVQSGLDLLCEQGVALGTVRSQTPLALPALASFLFGLAPDELKLASNIDFVHADLESFSERAFEKGWTTAFFGSTPLFMRRSGLAQGFEFFEESTQVEPTRWGRRNEQIVQSFTRWLADRGPEPFYSVLTFSDLNFPWAKTTSLSGQERSRTVESQIDALFESWMPLFRALKEQRIWNDTWIVVVGLQGRGEDFNRFGVGALVKAPKGVELPAWKEQSLTLTDFSGELHRLLFQAPSPLASDSQARPSAVVPWPAGPFWVLPSGAKERVDVLKQKIASNPGLRPWLLNELLDQNRAQEFIQVAADQPDAAPFWDRVLNNRKTQILQDACLRMIDLKIFEGGGTKTCESPTLLALQEWMRQTESGNQEMQLREARQKTLRSLHELRTLRRAHLINYALGKVLPLQDSVGNEILRAEMALRLPELQSTKTWLDQAEPSLTENPD